MALISCPECKKQISETASACPNCGFHLTPDKKVEIKRKVSVGPNVNPVVGVIILLGVSAFLFWIYSKRDYTAEVLKSAKTMNIKVSIGMYDIAVRNISTSDVSGKTITVYINGDPPFTYNTYCIAPSVGESIDISLRDFTYKGERFNPETQAVYRVWVGGAGYDYKAYGH